MLALSNFELGRAHRARYFAAQRVLSISTRLSGGAGASAAAAGGEHTVLPSSLCEHAVRKSPRRDRGPERRDTAQRQATGRNRMPIDYAHFDEIKDGGFAPQN